MRRVAFPDVFRGIEPRNYFSPDNEIPAFFAPRGRWKSGAMHTFCDDYRQEFFWRRPQEGLIVAITAGVVTAPDYSVWIDDPKPWRQYQAWRSAVVAAYWIEHGVSVLPVVSFNSGCERWVEKRSAWAVRGPCKADEAVWCKGVERWAKVAEPGRLVLFGRVPEVLPDVCEVVGRRLVSGKGLGSTAQKEGA